MKLEKVKIKNFRGYKDETEIPISNLTSFIGKNDAGKSTILEALEIFFNNSLVNMDFMNDNYTVIILSNIDDGGNSGASIVADYFKNLIAKKDLEN